MATQDEGSQNKSSELSRNNQGKWIPILDYAVTKGVSLSTLRRYIKSNKVVHRMENGRYLIFDKSDSDIVQDFAQEFAVDRIQDLQQKLNLAYEQINELKMLVAIYEEQLQSK